MIFTNAYFLIGLIFTAIPFILHLITKKQIKILKFPSLIFIKKSLQKESRKIKLKEILLLIIRTLVIVFLVLSLAKPVVYYGGRKKIFASSKEQKSIVIILDNSYSMGLISKGESLFNKSKRITLDIIHKLLDDNDNLSLILTADVNRIKFYDLTYNKEDIVQHIKEVKISFLKNHFFKSIQDAEKILDKSGNPRRIIYIITDMQKNIFMRNEDFIYKYLKVKYPVFIIKNSAEGQKNSAVIDHQISMKLNFRGDTVSFQPLVRNFSSLQNNLIIKSIINNEAVNQKSISLKPDQKSTINMQYIISSTGYLGGFSEITDGDDLMYDNKNYFVLFVPRQISIGVYDNKNEMFYVLNAINPAYVLDNKIKSYLNIREYRTIPSSLKNGVFILNYDYLNPKSIDEIKNILSKGSILIFPSADLSINNFNSVLAKNRIVEGLMQKRNINRKEPFQIEFIDYSHPVFSIFKDLTIFKNTRIYSYYKLKLDSLSYNTRIIAKFSNGDPAIVEYNYVAGDELRAGKVLLFTFLPDIKHTDLVYSPNFPPLIHQVIKYLVYRSEEEMFNKFTIGQTVDDVFSLLEVKKKTIENVLDKDEDSIIDNVIVKPGIYKVENKLLAVNLDYEESNLTAIPVKEIVKNYRGLSIISAENKKEIQEKVFSALSARSLWKFFLVIALILLILELIIANELYKYILQRFKS